MIEYSLIQPSILFFYKILHLKREKTIVLYQGMQSEFRIPGNEKCCKQKLLAKSVQNKGIFRNRDTKIDKLHKVIN